MDTISRVSFVINSESDEESKQSQKRERSKHKNIPKQPVKRSESIQSNNNTNNNNSQKMQINNRQDSLQKIQELPLQAKRESQSYDQITSLQFEQSGNNILQKLKGSNVRPSLYIDEGGNGNGDNIPSPAIFKAFAQHMLISLRAQIVPNGFQSFCLIILALALFYPVFVLLTLRKLLNIAYKKCVQRMQSKKQYISGGTQRLSLSLLPQTRGGQGIVEKTPKMFQAFIQHFKNCFEDVVTLLSDVRDQQIQDLMKIILFLQAFLAIVVVQLAVSLQLSASEDNDTFLTGEIQQQFARYDSDQLNLLQNTTGSLLFFLLKINPFQQNTVENCIQLAIVTALFTLIYAFTLISSVLLTQPFLQQNKQLDGSSSLTNNNVVIQYNSNIEGNQENEQMTNIIQSQRFNRQKILYFHHYLISFLFLALFLSLFFTLRLLNCVVYILYSYELQYYLIFTISFWTLILVLFIQLRQASQRSARRKTSVFANCASQNWKVLSILQRVFVSLYSKENSNVLNDFFMAAITFENCIFILKHVSLNVYVNFACNLLELSRSHLRHLATGSTENFCAHFCKGLPLTQALHVQRLILAEILDDADKNHFNEQSNKNRYVFQLMHTVFYIEKSTQTSHSAATAGAAGGIGSASNTANLQRQRKSSGGGISQPVLYSKDLNNNQANLAIQRYELTEVQFYTYGVQLMKFSKQVLQDIAMLSFDVFIDKVCRTLPVYCAHSIYKTVLCDAQQCEQRR